MSSAVIDLNADLGESFGRWRLGNDQGMMRSVTSVNIACGFHAGDPTTMRETVAAALETEVGIGAHPGFPDLLGFGRRRLDATASEVADMVVYQVGALHGVVAAAGAELRHVKPHGALYNMTAERPDVCEAVARAVAAVDPELPLVVKAGATADAAEAAGARVVREGFIDLDYAEDGSLLLGTIADPPPAEEIARRAVIAATDGVLRTRAGVEMKADPETLCLHGDAPNAVATAAVVRDALEAAGVRVLPLADVMEVA